MITLFTKFTKNNRKGYMSRVGLIIMDILLIGGGLVLFSLFHHVLPQKGIPAVDATDRPIYTPLYTPSTTPAPGETGAGNDGKISVGWEYSKFTDGEVHIDDDNYFSNDVAIEITHHDVDGVKYHIMDIHIRNIANLKTAFANDTYGKGIRDWTINIANNHNAIAAINGDYYGTRDLGLIIRNGTTYRDTTFRDILVLYYDGSMQTYAAGEIDAYLANNRGAYQSWAFGPMLIDENGEPMTEFNSDVLVENPRSAIGYYEPGHYCFVSVEGRRPTNSRGYTMSELSKLMCDLGCEIAYNLDGGRTSTMVFNGQLVNVLSEGGRGCSDIIYIREIDD